MTGKLHYITTVGDWKTKQHLFASSHWIAVDPQALITDQTKIIVGINADEGVHLMLEQDTSFEALPHPLSTGSVGAKLAGKLAAHGVQPSHTAFEVLNLLKKKHPLVGYTVF